MRCLLTPPVLLLLAASLAAAEPTIRNVNVRGLQVGGTTTVTIDGDDLGKAPKLLLPFPAKPTLSPKSTDKQAVFDVALDDAVSPGYHHLRLVADGGVSLPVLIGVDRLPQKPFAATVEALPVALHGTIGGSSVLETTFTGKAGQKLTAEVEAARLGSKLRPVLHLYGPKKLQVAWSWANPALLGDTRLETTLPADGTYTVTLHDAEYAVPGAGFFRLKLGQWNYADAVFPPVVGPDTPAVELIGSTPAKLDLLANRNPFLPLPWPKDGTWSGPRPFAEPGARAELIAGHGDPATMLRVGPVAVSERIEKPFDEAKFRLPVTPGTKVRFEVFAERLGSPLDATLVIRNDSGVELARAEDGPGTLDPVLEFTVPATVTAVTVGVVDSQGRGGTRAVYRLTVDPLSGPMPGDYRLTTPAQRVTLPVGGRVVVPVFADRRGFGGKIDLAADSLPAGVTLTGTTIAPDADGALVALGGTAADAGVTAWHGRGENAMLRPVLLKGHPLERLQPWLASELAIGPSTAKPTDFAIEWRGLPDTAVLSPAGKLALPVKVARLDPAAPARLTLLTSQSPPTVNGQPDLAKTIRPEKPMELGAKVSDGELVALLPPELPAAAYDVAVQAELLSADKQRVLATAFTTVKKLPVRLPVTVKLETPARIEAKLDPKAPATAEVKGTVERLNGFTGDATVTLGGLPPGVQTAPATVKAAETAFVVQVRVLPTAMLGETRGLKLSATVAPDPKQPTTRIKSRDIELTLAIR